ncbi:CocE/NonD family hydrolase [Gordonia desulfuricans]|uniref:CocE/NonD family hydrolase n=1 Tax=Gordonia desulfuricans TaxID=89051 RepID=A0A7K3LPN8_9ACTN|nr:CocE/NonD family hydrolase [Gordonia desulfuricans]NDK90178.1 CocE/NonD family hydrolase [Gordonia desulfuricans]
MRVRGALGVVMASVTAVIMTLVAGPGAAMASTPDGGAAAQRWLASHDGPQPNAGVAITWDVPIRMSDGTVLRANVYRPANAAQRPITGKTPVIVNMTPYTKLVSAVGAAALQHPVLEPFLQQITGAIDLHGTPIDGITDIAQTLHDGGARTFAVDYDLVRSGYTMVVVDVRGTGFSQGRWDVFQQREQQDTVEVIDWAAHQRWSDGNVGMAGVSYSAINQIQAANKRPPALKAIFPVEPGGDLIRDIVAPGGALGVGFLPMWLTLINTSKMIPNVASMLNGTFDWKWLADRISDPLTFYPQLFAALLTPDVRSIPPELGDLLANGTAPREAWQAHAERITTPTFIYGGWFDLFTNSEVKMYNGIPLPPGKKQLIMGDGYHLTIGGGQGRPGTPPRLDVLQKAWFDRWLKGVHNGIDEYGPVNLKQVGDPWITAQQFPRAGMTRQRLYLGDKRSGTAPHAVADGSLTTAVPSSRGRMTISPGVLTVCSRDSAQQTAGATAVFGFCADDARISERNALSFTSAPVPTTRSVSGYSSVRVNAVMDATDGYWTATLNDVAPDGTSKVISSGQVMASLRAYDRSRSQFAPNGDVIDPFYELTLASRQPVTPGKAVSVDIGLLPTEALIRAGHRLRVDVFAMNLPRGLPLRPLLNESQLRPEHIQLDPNRPSFVNLPLSTPM